MQGSPWAWRSMSRHLKALLASGDLHLGTWTQTAALELIDLIGLNVFNFTIIDCEHDVFGMETAENLARSTDANDIASAVRLPSNDPVMIMRALDVGIPMLWCSIWQPLIRRNWPWRRPLWLGWTARRLSMLPRWRSLHPELERA